MDNKKTVIFDLDGTLALIDDRRAISTNDNGKMDWDKFFDPVNIQLDKPNWPVILMAQTLKKAGHSVVIFSGRSKATKDATRTWLNNHKIPFDVLKMRPTDGGLKWMKDDLLKKKWLTDLFPDVDKILCVFDDRDKVVKMWRDNGIACFQVADGNF
jgi:hypothetical protein